MYIVYFADAPLWQKQFFNQNQQYVVFAPLKNKKSRQLCTYPTFSPTFGQKMHLTPFGYNDFK